jgi:beta-glucanase (GH16 family)
VEKKCRDDFFIPACFTIKDKKKCAMSKTKFFIFLFCISPICWPVASAYGQMSDQNKNTTLAQSGDLAIARTFQNLVWYDEFNYNGLPDSTKWSFATDRNNIGWGNNELQWYTDSKPENANVGGGTLKITAIKEPINGKKYSSARLTTKNKASWKYCKVEVRAKLPTGRGTWPAIWMMPQESIYGGWPKSGEIDIMEHVGFNPDTVFSTVHTGKFNHMIGTQVGKKIEVPTATTNFHVYSMEWEENEIRSYVDGKHYFTFKNNGQGFEAWPFDQPFHIILNLAIGGGLGGKKGVDDTLFPHVYEIDYVRVYK